MTKGQARIGDNPLDALIPQEGPDVSQEAAPKKREAGSKGKERKEEKKRPAPKFVDVKERITFNIPLALIEEIKNAVVQLSGPPEFLNLSRLAEDAIRNELERLTKEHNEGKPFAPRGDRSPKLGRPIS